MPRLLLAFTVSLVIALLMVAVVHPQVGANLYNPPALNRLMWWVFIPAWVGGFIAYLIGGKRKV